MIKQNSQPMIPLPDLGLRLVPPLPPTGPDGFVTPPVGDGKDIG
jgi:hypothetical protein